jgi:hypothetical protein
VTASYAIGQSSRLLRVCASAREPFQTDFNPQNVDDNEDRRELLGLQRRLDRKIQVFEALTYLQADDMLTGVQIISPSIDMIEMM